MVNIKIRKAKYKMENVKIKKLKENAVIPKKAFPYDAGWDLAACLDCDSISIPVGETVKIGTGLAIAVPNGYFGGILPEVGFLQSKVCVLLTVLEFWIARTVTK